MADPKQKRVVEPGSVEPLTNEEIEALIEQKIKLAQSGELDAELDQGFANLLRAKPITPKSKK